MKNVFILILFMLLSIIGNSKNGEFKHRNGFKHNQSFQESFKHDQFTGQSENFRFHNESKFPRNKFHKEGKPEARFHNESKFHKEEGTSRNKFHKEGKPEFQRKFKHNRFDHHNQFIKPEFIGFNNGAINKIPIMIEEVVVHYTKI